MRSMSPSRMPSSRMPSSRMPLPRMSPSGIAVACVLAASLAACQRTAPAPDATADAPAPAAPPAAPPASAPAPARDGLQAFLTARYGEGARVEGEWTGVPADAALRLKAGETAPGTVTRRVCEQEEMTLAGKPTVLLAVCGSPRDIAHYSPGLTDLFMLQDEGGRWVPRASGHFEQFGSMGTTGDVEGERLGADLAGFVVEGGMTGQGHTVSNRTILLPRDGSFREAASFLAGMDDDVLREGCNASAGECPPGEPYDLDFDLDIDDANPAAAAYPLRVHEEGTACGRKVDVRHVLTLDPATLTYAVPAPLTRELPCEDAAP